MRDKLKEKCSQVIRLTSNIQTWAHECRRDTTQFDTAFVLVEAMIDELKMASEELQLLRIRLRGEVRHGQP